MKHPALADGQRAALDRFRALVDRYHATLDLVSDAALDDWEGHVAGALDYAALLSEAAPDSTDALLDLGAGVGLPGLVLAIVLPERQVHLVERRRRRSTFLTLAAAALGCDNVRVHASDASDLARAEVSPTGVAAVTAQAVATFETVYRATSHLHADRVLLASRKGSDWKAEIAALERACSVSAQARSMPTRPRGTLVAIDVPGGRACPSSE